MIVSTSMNVFSISTLMCKSHNDSRHKHVMMYIEEMMMHHDLLIIAQLILLAYKW